VRLHRFWPANRPGGRNNPWNERSSVGRDRGAVSLRVAPLLRQADDLVASGVAVFDVCTSAGEEGRFPSVELECLLPAKVRAGDGVSVQADLVDVSLFLTPDRIGEEAGRLSETGDRRWSRWDLDARDPVSLFTDLGGWIAQGLLRTVIHPTGIDRRAWDPRHATFSLQGPSLGGAPQARAGRYVIAGCWEKPDWSGASYSLAGGLRLRGERLRLAANVLEFELLALKDE
jgi:hypothetical protein